MSGTFARGILIEEPREPLRHQSAARTACADTASLINLAQRLDATRFGALARPQLAPAVRQPLDGSARLGLRRVRWSPALRRGISAETQREETGSRRDSDWIDRTAPLKTGVST